MPKRETSINLLQKEKGKNLDRFLNWALSIGRVLVIATELIALLAFLYRFSLDQKLIDLHGEIRNKQAIVEQFKDSEQTYRNLQDRLFLAASLTDISGKRTKIYNDILGLAPLGLNFDNVSLYQNNIQIEATVTSVNPLGEFIALLKAYPAIETVSIDKIENKTSTASIKVSITGNLKEEYQINEPIN